MSSARRTSWPGLAAGLLLGVALLSPALAGEAAPEAEKTADAAKPADAAGAAAAPAKPAAAAPSPSAAVRALQALQDQVAQGSVAAQAAQPRMLAHVAEVFAAADPAVWKEPRNADAAALYLFSAGRAGVVRAVLERGAAFTPAGDRLVKGALAYAEGQDEIARTLLAPFDPKALPPSLGGHLALVMAVLLADKDRARADAMLDAARLLVPGTLVEEAALRRQIFLLADSATLDKLAKLSRQYIRRFHGSVFASNFNARLLSFAVRTALEGDVALLAKLDPVFAELPQAERRATYLVLSRDALVAGRPEAARYAAARAAALSPGPAEGERARLYAAAAGAASDTAPAARASLAALDAARLPPRDAELRDAALTMSASVDAGLGDHGQAVGRDEPAPDSPAAALIARAQRAMTAGDALLAAAPSPSSPPDVKP